LSERQDVVAALAGVPAKLSDKKAMISRFRIDRNELQGLIDKNFQR
jgi:hypothetical protein